MLIDTHAHLTWDSFEPDLQEVISRAKEAGITHVINIGADMESSKKAAKLECPGMNSPTETMKSSSCLTTIKYYSSIGLHPHESEKNIPVEELEKIYQSHPEKVIAVGECGLDYHFAGIDFIPSSTSQDQLKKLQKKLFQEQISLAKKLNLPLIIHSRDSWEDIFLPELTGNAGVFHSFTGNTEQAKKVLDLGYYLGFTCIVTYPKNDHLRQIIKETPLDKILTETDCPFLPPQTKRGQRCEPADVVEVVKVIAQMKNLSLEEVAQASFQNAQSLFHFN
ncbi:MAG: TatD family hydrolase [Candidatus Daviesbacteria bacterium]|nr:TatD family hydrolase [Candidatus Daviesbacteria bacterium]